jgi:membrane protease YdiL (CAAX protease family)
MTDTQNKIIGIVLRVFVFAFVAILGQMLFPWALMPFGLLVAGAIGTFAAASVANALALRIYERGQLADIGLGWHPDALRHLGIGLLFGAGAAIIVAGVPIGLGMASFVPTPDYPLSWGSIFFVGFVLLFGAVGEEMLFRGYGFQVLAGAFGTYQVLLPISVLFAAAHAGNQNSSALGLFSTFLWGVLLGFAFMRSRDLWLPIGLHFGWNFTLPLFGVNLSGFTMGMTGYTLQWRAGPLWSGGAYGPEASLQTVLVIPVLFYLLIKAPVVRQKSYLVPGEEE